VRPFPVELLRFLERATPAETGGPAAESTGTVGPGSANGQPIERLMVPESTP